MRLESLLLATFALGGCRSVAPGDGVCEPDVRAEITKTVEDLYDAFGFEAGGEPDWVAMRAIFAQGASFVAPIAEGSAARAVGSEEFLSDFASYAASEPVAGTGLLERIVHLRVDAFGAVGHAFVTFEGHVPGEPTARTRGLDSLQLVRDSGRWKVVSFTTQYESAGHPLPRRFLPRATTSAAP